VAKQYGLSVLILLLVEYPFGQQRNYLPLNTKPWVLILLLVEYPFGRLKRPFYREIYLYVLILLLVEYPFGRGYLVYINSFDLKS